MEDLTYANWIEYLETDNSMYQKWNKITSLGKQYEGYVVNTIKRDDEKLKEKKEQVKEQIFNVIMQNVGEKMDFSWKRELYTSSNGYLSYRIQMNDSKMMSLFENIKSMRHINSIQGNSVDAYLKPVMEKIYALKMAKDAGKPQMPIETLSYKSMKVSASGGGLGCDLEELYKDGEDDDYEHPWQRVNNR